MVDSSGAFEICVVIPAYNEEGSIRNVIRQVPPVVSGMSVRVVVVDDGSEDQTAQVAASLGAIVLRHTKNRGQGAAIKRGLKLAAQRGCRVAVCLDGDGQHDPQQLHRLVKPVVDDEADFVWGSRFKGETSEWKLERMLGIRFLSGLMSILVGKRVTDPTNGFRAFRAELLSKVRSRELRYNSLELIVQAKKQGLRLHEVPVSVHPRQSGETKKPRLRYFSGLLRGLARSLFAA